MQSSGIESNSTSKSKTQKLLKTGVLFTSPLYLRSWFDTGVLGDLKKKTDLTLYVPENETVVLNTLKDFQIVKISLPKNMAIELEGLLDWIQNLKSSSSFRMRYKRIMLGDKFWIEGLSFGRRFFMQLGQGLFHLIRIVFTKPWYLFLRVPFLVRIIRAYTKLKLRKFVIPGLESVQEQVDWLLIPSLAYDAFLEPVIRHAKKNNTRTFLVLDNWDNLTSKLVFRTQPDLINVMGISSVKLASRIHGFSESSIAVIGLPRFELHKSLRKSSKLHQIHQKHFIEILYAGISTPWMEVDFVNRFSERLTSMSKRGQDIRLSYRPHPGGPRHDFSRLHSGIILNRMDEQERLNFGGLPRMGKDYFEPILSSDLIVAPPTTLVLEAIILGKPVIVDARIDGIHRVSPGLLIQEYEHLRQLLEIRGLAVAKTDQAMEDYLSSFFEGKLEQPSQADVHELVYMGQEKFGDLILNSIAQIKV
jgi:hypothetical protein